MLAVFGLTIIGTLASGNIVKGLLSGAAGLAISTVDLDLESGFPRFAFGSTDLQGGIGFVPAVIGLFSLHRRCSMCEEPTPHHPADTGQGWRRLAGLPTRAELARIRPERWRRSSLIGVVIGILARRRRRYGSWTAYNEASAFPATIRTSARARSAAWPLPDANNATTAAADGAAS